MGIGDLSNPELVTIAVALLGGDKAPVDREDIAIKVDGIAPGKFNWRKYPKRIDLTTVHFALQDAAKKRHGGLLTGDMKQGWMLSPAGVRWLQQLDLSDLETEASEQFRRGSVSANQRTESNRLRKTRAYELFVSGEPEAITRQDFFKFARINEYFQTKTRQRRYAAISNAIAIDGGKELSDLWNLLQERFPEEFS